MGEAEVNTDIILSAVKQLLNVTETVAMPTKALIAYVFLDEDGTEKFDYVVTESMGLLETLGIAKWIQADTIDGILD